MTFEYDRFKRFATIKRQLIYFFNSSVIVFLIIAGRTNSGICGSSIGSTLVVPYCVKAVSIHVIGTV
jgi:hypothetical protein